MNFPQQEKYDWYNRIYEIPESPIRSELEKIMRKGWHHRIEPSIKVDTDKFHPNRFNIWYWNQAQMPGVIKAFMQLVAFVEESKQGSFDLDPYKELFKRGMKLSHARVLAIGIDLRPEKMESSRLKIGVALKNRHKELIRDYFDPQTGNLELDEFFYQNTNLIGFDFGFNGNTSIKVYPGFRKDTFDNELLKQHFSPKENELLLKSISAFYSVVDNTTPEKRVLTVTIPEKHLQPIMQHEPRLHWMENGGRYIFSFLPVEFEKGKIERFNLYYWE